MQLRQLHQPVVLFIVEKHGQTDSTALNEYCEMPPW